MVRYESIHQSQTDICSNASSETTATTAVFTDFELPLHPDIQSKLFSELYEALRNADEALPFEKREKLP